MNSTDMFFAAGGAFAFAIVYLVLSFLFSSDPAYANAIAGGIAWFVAALVLRLQLRKPRDE